MRKGIALSLLLLSFSLSGEELPTPKIHRLYKVASHLTGPVCESHRMMTQIYFVDEMYPDASCSFRAMKKTGLAVGSVLHGTVALATTVPGLALRYLAMTMQKESYCYQRGDSSEEADSQELCLLSWNVCGIPGGYVYTNGGVTPWWKRIDVISEQIIDSGAHLVSLYEVFDIKMAEHLIQRLRPHFTHFYYHMGARLYGTSSGLFIASKRRLSNPQFYPYPREKSHGRARNCGRGFFRCQIGNGEFVATHLQHSEVPHCPVQGEKEARRNQLEHLFKQLHFSGTLILTGDFNMIGSELREQQWLDQFVGHKLDDECTWGGNAWCVKKQQRECSPPQILDYTLVRNGRLIQTKLIETHFTQGTFNIGAYSDHKGLLSTIQLD